MDQIEDKPKNLTPDRFWFRVHNEVLHDMTFIDMPDADLGTYVRLLALANSTKSVGIIQGDAARIAKALRLTVDETDAFLQRMEARDLIVVDDAMVAILDERHYEGKGLAPSQSREAQNIRQRNRRAKLKEEGNAAVTRCHSDASRDIEENSDSIEQTQPEKRIEEKPIEEDRTTIRAERSEVPYIGDSLGQGPWDDLDPGHHDGILL